MAPSEWHELHGEYEPMEVRRYDRDIHNCEDCGKRFEFFDDPDYVDVLCDECLDKRKADKHVD
jgi:hypothetical protein